MKMRIFYKYIGSIFIQINMPLYAQKIRLWVADWAIFVDFLDQGGAQPDIKYRRYLYPWHINFESAPKWTGSVILLKADMNVSWAN